jgi:probable DNA metabolism protein
MVVEGSCPASRRAIESSFEKRIWLVSRHCATNNRNLIASVRQQVKELGVEYVMSNVSYEARLLFLRSREVSNEIYRGKAFMRFVHSGDLLITRFRFIHDIEDLIVRYFARKFSPKVILILSKRAWIGRGEAIVSFSASAIKSRYTIRESKDFLWDAYYDSCFIESRRNKGLAQKVVPKRYWRVIQEGGKLERGIQASTLEKWL